MVRDSPTRFGELNQKKRRSAILSPLKHLDLWHDPLPAFGLGKMKFFHDILPTLGLLSIATAPLAAHAASIARAAPGSEAGAGVLAVADPALDRRADPVAITGFAVRNHQTRSVFLVILKTFTRTALGGYQTFQRFANRGEVDFLNCAKSNFAENPQPIQKEAFNTLLICEVAFAPDVDLEDAFTQISNPGNPLVSPPVHDVDAFVGMKITNNLPHVPDAVWSTMVDQLNSYFKYALGLVLEYEDKNPPEEFGPDVSCDPTQAQAQVPFTA
ncbi:MAG: hypothetical protein M1833_003522 [Piccolia ochrophora]|nr:MAG: hypothetical protein M1833_003522 [Piccolia ochrophora]